MTVKRVRSTGCWVALAASLALIAGYVSKNSLQSSASRFPALPQLFDALFVVATATGVLVIFLEVRDYLRPNQWRWRRAIVWLSLIATVVAIGGLAQILSIVNSPCSASAAYCNAIETAAIGITYGVPVTLLSWALPLISGRWPSHTSE